MKKANDASQFSHSLVLGHNYLPHFIFSTVLFLRETQHLLGDKTWPELI